MFDSVGDRLNLPGDSLPVEVVLLLVDMRLASTGVHRDKQAAPMLPLKREFVFCCFGEKLTDVRKFGRS